MLKVLQVLHICSVFLMLLFNGPEPARLIMKCINPTNDFARFWHPSLMTAVHGFAFIALLGVLIHETGFVKTRSPLIPEALYLTWLTCFSWLIWFSHGLSFRPVKVPAMSSLKIFEEGVSPDYPARLAQAMIVFVSIAALVGQPVILRWYRMLTVRRRA